jgi:hypothetical protein
MLYWLGNHDKEKVPVHVYYRHIPLLNIFTQWLVESVNAEPADLEVQL